MNDDVENWNGYKLQKMGLFCSRNSNSYRAEIMGDRKQVL
jgi:hypothetical protein